MADSPSELQFEIEKLERKHAENPEGRFFVPLANAYRKMGDVETAEALLRAGVERHPDYLSAHIVLGRCLADRGALGEAEEEFRFVLSEDPQNLIALRTLGELAVAGGRQGEAAEWYRELLAVDPMNEEARQALDALNDAPAPEAGTEFQSGAGWWQAAGEEDAAAAEPPSPEVAAEEPGAPAEVSGAGQADVAEEQLYGWDDLPGLRADEAAAIPAREAEPEDEVAPGAFEAPDADELPGLRADEVAWTSIDTGTAGPLDADSDEDDDGGARYTDDGSSEVVTETIAELYARQGLHERAASVYRELIRRRGSDETLERRLAEVESLADTGADRFEPLALADEERSEPRHAEPGQDRPESVPVADDEEGREPGLALADEEALLTPPVDAEADPFASTFEHGFTTEYEEHPLPELAPNRAEPEPGPAGNTAAAAAEGVSIAELLGGLASWRREAPARTEPAAAEAEAAVEAEAAATSPHPGEAFGTTTFAEAAEGIAPAAMEPWEEEPAAEESADTDLPYLEEATAAPAAGGTRPAEEEEPFPWELPAGESALEQTGQAAEPEVGEPALDPFFIDDVEPAGMRSEETLPDAPPATPHEARQEPSPGPRAIPSDPTEDEDLESFQAWLRSLKR